jgi:hypothetical protein
MSPRNLLWSAVVVVALAAACSSDKAPTAASSDTDAASARTSACRDVPGAGPALSWLPADLPLPDGSYAIQDLDASGPPPTVASETHRGLIAVHGSIDDFVTFINTQWIAQGWSLGKGDAEQGEAEGGYRRDDVGGAYRVRDVYCDPTFTELLLVFGPGATESESESASS